MMRQVVGAMLDPMYEDIRSWPVGGRSLDAIDERSQYVPNVFVYLAEQDWVQDSPALLALVLEAATPEWDEWRAERLCRELAQAIAAAAPYPEFVGVVIASEEKRRKVSASARKGADKTNKKRAANRELTRREQQVIDSETRLGIQLGDAEYGVTIASDLRRGGIETKSSNVIRDSKRAHAKLKR